MPSIVVDLGAFGLHREHQARPHRVAVDQHRARAAHAVLAPEVRAGERAGPRGGSRRASCAASTRSRARALAVDGQRDRRCSATPRLPDRLRRRRRGHDARADAGPVLGRRVHVVGRRQPAATRGARSRRGRRVGDRCRSSAASAVDRADAAWTPCRRARSRARADRAVVVELDGARRRRRARSRRGGERTRRPRSRSDPPTPGSATAVEQLVGLAARWSRCPRRSRRPGCVASPPVRPTSSSASSASATAGSSAAGVGVGDRAADRAAVADLEVADERQRLGEQRRGGGDVGVVLGDGLPGRSPRS